MILIRSNPQFSFLNQPNAYFLVSGTKSNSHHDHHPKDGNEVDTNRRTPVYEIRDVHVTEEKNSFMISMDLPGVKEKDVEIVEDKFALSVRAVRKNGGDKAICIYRRTFALDKKSVIPDGITATLSEGVMTIIIPKKPAPEQINVTPHSTEPPEEVEDNIFFRMDMPGVKLHDLKVSVTGDELSVSADRKKGSTTTSSIKRMFTVDDDKLETGKIDAYLCDGVLTLTAPPRKMMKLTNESSSQEDGTTDDKNNDTSSAALDEKHIISVNNEANKKG